MMHKHKHIQLMRESRINPELIISDPIFEVAISFEITFHHEAHEEHEVFYLVPTEDGGNEAKSP